MSDLGDISYSRDETVAAFDDYYQFLTKMYLPEWAIVRPPVGGWPSITKETWGPSGKTDEVINLLAHLPYICRPTDCHCEMQGGAYCHFADYSKEYWSLYLAKEDGATSFKMRTEGHFYDEVPAHVLGLTVGGRDGAVFLLDTQLGIVHWVDCHNDVLNGVVRVDVGEDNFPDDNWRTWSPAWAVADFFEVLKDQFRRLNFVPVNERSVRDVWTIFGGEDEGVIPFVQGIYQEYGWPDLEKYNKKECLDAVRNALEKHYPRFADE